jgi:hypothetical protein
MSCDTSARTGGREPTFDFVVSLLSCGHHYPTDTYIELFRDYVNRVECCCSTCAEASQNNLADWFDEADVISEDERSLRPFRKRLT